VRDASQQYTQHWKVVDQLTDRTYWFDSEEQALMTAIAVEKATFVHTVPVFSLSGHREGAPDDHQ
jgi:hypothetical protein